MAKTKIEAGALAVLLALQIIAAGVARAETTNEQSATATATYKDGKWSYGASGTVSQTNNNGSRSNTNSATVTYDTKQGTSVSGTSSNKSTR